MCECVMNVCELHYLDDQMEYGREVLSEGKVQTDCVIFERSLCSYVTKT